MIKRVSTTEAAANFPALVAAVAKEHARIIIEQEGQPVATLIGISDTATIEPGTGGALALVGAAGDLTDDEIDAMVTNIYAQRDHDLVRPIDTPE